MRIVIPGGSGQVGTILARHFASTGHDVVVLSRNVLAVPENWRLVGWDARTLGAWVDTIDGADVVINLAGRSVNCRYTPENRTAIINSRVESARVLGHAIAQVSRPPSVWLQASTATIYSHRFDAPNDDVTGIVGGDEPQVPGTWRFSIDVAKQWEAAALAHTLPSTRTVLLRSALTLSPDTGGVFDVLAKLVRFWLGGSNGSGRQYVSWIHETDFISAVEWCIARDLSGAIAVAAPGPVPNAEFMRTLRKALGVRIGLPATTWMLEIGAIAMQTETELILKSRRVVPTRLLEDGFSFAFPEWEAAAADLVARWITKDSVAYEQRHRTE
jgi:uncharacterized protein